MPISPDQTGEAAPDEYPSDPAFVMVLDDGETFSPLAGCKIVDTQAPQSPEEVEDLLAEPAGALLFEFSDTPPEALIASQTRALDEVLIAAERHASEIEARSHTDAAIAEGERIRQAIRSVKTQRNQNPSIAHPDERDR